MPPFPAHPIGQAIRAVRPSAQANAMWRSPGSAPSPPIPISFAAIRLSTVTAKCSEITHGSRRHVSRLGIAATPFRRTLPRERSDRSRLVWGAARPKQILASALSPRWGAAGPAALLPTLSPHEIVPAPSLHRPQKSGQIHTFAGALRAPRQLCDCPRFN